MKKHKLNPADLAVVEALGAQLMAMNNRNDRNANQSSTYGHISNAISAFVLNQTGIDISHEDWNLGGNGSVGADIEQAIADTVDRLAYEAVFLALGERDAGRAVVGVCSHKSVALLAAHRLARDWDLEVNPNQLLSKSA